MIKLLEEFYWTKKFSVYNRLYKLEFANKQLIFVENNSLIGARTFN